MVHPDRSDHEERPELMAQLVQPDRLVAMEIKELRENGDLLDRLENRDNRVNKDNVDNPVN